jgi:para-aminobenzoate synthetase/4-amino-4-deoxychorismate lyase
MPLHARFDSLGLADPDWTVRLARPVRTLEAWRPDEVAPALAELESAAVQGRWVALMLAYEAAPALDPDLAAHAPEDFPLLWAAVFDGPQPTAKTPLPLQAPAPPPAPDWRPLVSRPQYLRSLELIRERIRLGETYQVNYTLPFECAAPADPAAWYESLLPAQQAGFAAFLDMGRHQVLSFSPELFFQRRGGLLRTRPMKGTMPRGRWTTEDDERAEGLSRCPKNRAENVMIVDLLRNDLGKLAVPGGVRVPALFEVERYPTVLQMTSTVEADLRPEAGLVDIMRAIFPCGSVTGAPKIRTMEIIHELEPFPRRAYCGAVGLLKPGGEAVCNVPIRTIVADKDSGRARFSVGGGITWASNAADEWEECRTKMAFLHRRAEDFELLESLLLQGGQYVLLQAHLERMAASARYFGFALPELELRRALEAVRTQHPAGRFKVRLLAGRDGSVRAEAAAIGDDSPGPVRLGVAPAPVDSNDVFLFHKTTRRGVYDQAQASRPDCDDALLVNERGEVAEACLANLVAAVEGELLTPSRGCGLLDGTFRRALLDMGLLREAVLRLEDLRRADALWVVNSVRGLRRAELVVKPS